MPDESTKLSDVNMQTDRQTGRSSPAVRLRRFCRPMLRRHRRPIVSAWASIWTVCLIGSAAGQPAGGRSGGDTGSAVFWIAPAPSPDAEGQTDATHWFAPGILTRTGRIVQLTDRRFEYQPAATPDPVQADAAQADTGRPPADTVVVSAGRVLWARPLAIGDSEKEAVDAFLDEQYDAALRKFVEAIEPRPPVWHQQWLSMAAAQAAGRASRGSIAIELVRQLDRRPLPPMVLGWLPLTWAGRDGLRINQDDAKAASDDPSPLVRLVAASALLRSDRTTAVATLRTLAGLSDRPHVATLAAMQQLRTATPIRIREDHEKLLARIESLPMALQTGPLVMLADKLSAAGAAPQARRLELSLSVVPIGPHPDVPGSLRALRRSDSPPTRP